jgi:all-trans-retinol dehydrogenase (NAD+)
MTDFTGKNVLITGAASGIGRLMAEKIAGFGAHVILWDVNKQALEALGAELIKQDRRVTTCLCDLTDRTAIYTTAKDILRESGPVDVLINNAGIVSGKTLLEAADEDIIRTFDVNTLALFWTTRAFLPEMIQRNSGHIVTIASAAGLVGTAKLIDYCASKFAAVGYADALRVELKRLGLDIKTTVICPYYISTGMFEGVKTRFSWLLPILKPEYVADRVVRAIQTNRTRLVLPPFVMSSYLMRLFPTQIFDSAMNLLGVNRSMDEFTGRSGH